MSRTISDNSQNTIVLVRAFRDEPLRLGLHGWTGDAAELEVKETGNTVLFPRRDVYRYDNKVFEALRAAYDAGDLVGVCQLWEKAESISS